VAVRARLFAVMVAFGVTVGAGEARGDVCPGPEPGLTVATVDSQERLDYLARAFDREVREIDAWSWIWGTTYTVGAIPQGVGLAYTHDHGTRIDLTVGTISTAFGAVTLYLLPLQLTLPLRSARRHWNDRDPCATLARAERTLVSVDKDEALANGIVAHLGNVAINVGIALILGLGYGRWSSAALNGGIGVAVGEANAFTQPHHLRDVLERYRSGRFDRTSPRLTVAVVPMSARDLMGVALRVTW
jgi:hypothetical protein